MVVVGAQRWFTRLMQQNACGCCRTRVRSGKMQGKKLFLDKEVTRFRLSERVPRHNEVVG